VGVRGDPTFSLSAIRVLAVEAQHFEENKLHIPPGQPPCIVVWKLLAFVWMNQPIADSRNLTKRVAQAESDLDTADRG